MGVAVWTFGGDAYVRKCKWTAEWMKYGYRADVLSPSKSAYKFDISCD